MPDEAALKDIAVRLKAAQDGTRQIAPITTTQAGFDDDAAYHVARHIHDLRLSEGFLAIGRKIGFTNSSIWPVYNVHQPIWGHVYDRTVSHVGEAAISFPIQRFTEPKLEPEIVLGFRTTPPPAGSPEEILACIDWIAHGIEIVQSHFPGWKFTSADTIADSALHGALLVGPPRCIGEMQGDIVAALERFSLTLRRDGVVQDRGSGVNVLGSPLKAIAHLSTVLAMQSQALPLQADELVTTGTLTQAMSIQAGETWTTELAGIDLSGLTVTFTD